MSQLSTALHPVILLGRPLYSMRSISRIVDVSINTVTKLLVDAGNACTEYQDKAFRNLTCKRIQVDEIWSFCYAKDKNVPKDKRGQFGVGDVWTFTAIDAESKIIPTWHIGNRDIENATIFMEDLACRLKSKVQLTTDGHKMYLEAVQEGFGREIDYAMLVKSYESTQEETRYSPARCTGCKGTPITGNPEFKHISTSYVERQNLNIRMGMRRFTRLTNGFSKKILNHFYAEAIYFMYYNFVRIHKTLRMTPAMKAGVTDHLWSMEEMAGLLK